MYAKLSQQCDEHLEGLVKEALGKGWQERTSKVLKEALDALDYDLHDYIGTELENNLTSHIQDVARLAAQDFLAALAEGHEAQVKQFLMLPTDYWPQRERLSWLDIGREHGPMGLRRRMLEAVRDRLEREVILDQEAQIKGLVEQVQRQEVELHRWRTGDLERSNA